MRVLNFLNRMRRQQDFRNFDVRAVEVNTPLLKILTDIIRQQGAITIENFMEIVLQHPNYGYYRHGDPIGPNGDFGTAPEISPMFGEMIGLWCIKAWKQLGCPDQFTLLELGPGRGTLLHDLFRFTEGHPAFNRALRLCLFESSETLRVVQEEKLANYKPSYIQDIKSIPPMPTIIIANEFFDNMPMRQFVKIENGWTERLIGIKDGELIFVRGKKIPWLNFLGEDQKNIENDWVYEISSQSQTIMQQLAAHIVKFTGLGLIIDYGYSTSDGQSTLHGWCRHKRSNVLVAPGKVDVTANVDFRALSRIAKEEGAHIYDLVDQGSFLESIGIRDRADLLLKSAAPEVAEKINVDLYKLTKSPRMGKLFKAMIVGSA